MSGVDDVFVTLDPPPGGLAAVRARIAAEARPRRVWVLAGLGGALAAAAAMALVMVWPAREVGSPWLDAALAARDPGLAALGLVETGAAMVVAPGSIAAVAPVETGVAGVVYYRAMGDPARARPE